MEQKWAGIFPPHVRHLTLSSPVCCSCLRQWEHFRWVKWQAFISLLILTSFRDVVAVMAWIELCATREWHSAVSLITFYWFVLNLGSGCLCFMFLSIVLSSQLLLLVESRFGWVLFAGIPNNDNSSLGYIWPKEWPFISFKHIKLGKSRYTRRFTPAKVRAHSNCKVTVSRHY